MSITDVLPPDIKTKITLIKRRISRLNSKKQPLPTTSSHRSIKMKAVLYPAGLLIFIGLFLIVAKNTSILPTPDASGEVSVNARSNVSMGGGQQLDVGFLPPYPGIPNEDSGIQRRTNIKTIIPERPRLDILKYSVVSGDSIFGISEKFNLKPETILWGNFDILQDDPHSLRPGQELNILPVDGTYYKWHDEDNLDRVAEFFGVDPLEIIDWPGNNLPPDLDRSNPEIEPGTSLVIPDGQREFVSWQAPRISRSNPAVARIAGPGACGSIYDGPVGEGFFVWPTTANILSGYNFSSFHPGIDIAGSTGNATFASASGVVVYAGWNNYGFGYMVVIDHGDGWQTLYGHMSQVNVACGQAVFQGSVIGGVGSTGNSSGAHLHFEMQHDAYGKVNPFDLVSP